MRLGADGVEADLVCTRDGVLVARHEPEISQTTDVAEHAAFGGHRTTKEIDGVAVTGWFTDDFTLAELKTLRARERIPQLRPDNAAFDGHCEIATFEEIVALVERHSSELGRRVGLWVELKHPSYFRAVGLPLEPAVVAALDAAGLDAADAGVVVQSFEVSSTRTLREQLDVSVLQLLEARDKRPYDFVAGGDARSYGALATPDGLREIAGYADAVGPAKSHIVPRDPRGASLPATTFVDDAHAAGLTVVPWTFRRENAFLPLELRSSTDPAGIGDAASELEQFRALGVDGVFTDNPDLAVAMRYGEC